MCESCASLVVRGVRGVVRQEEVRENRGRGRNECVEAVVCADAVGVMNGM